MTDMSNKTILVTGATGLIGSHLVYRLLNDNVNVIALGRSKNKIKKVFEPHLTNSHFSYMETNILYGIPDSIGQVDFIFHAASPISGSEIKSKPLDVIEANLMGTKQCLEFLRHQKDKTGICGRMVIFSSATVYGNQPVCDISISEEETGITDALDNPNIAYSESKRMIEVLARSYFIQYNIESLIVRIGYVYGYATYKPNTAFYEFIDNAIIGHDIFLNNSGMGRRDNIFVEDVINGLLIVALSGMPGEAYNISSNGDKDNFKAIDEIARIIADSINDISTTQKICVHMRDAKHQRAPGIRLNNSKLKKLGWSLETSIQEGIKKTIQEYIKMKE